MPVAWLTVADPIAISDARAAGARAVVAPLSALPRDGLGALAARGLTHAHVVLAGPDARAHDFVRGVAGEHDQLVARIGAARGFGIEVVASTPLHRSLYRVLGATAHSLASRGVAAWSVEVGEPPERDPEGAWPATPRLSIALPYALHAIATARSLGVVAMVRGAPLCLLGRLADRALESGARSFGAPCAACGARASCPGVSAPYLARFGDRELAARAGPIAVPARPPREALLAEILARAPEAP